MTAASTDQFSAPLGVGSIVGESFSILFRNFLKVMILGFIPTLLGLVISGVLIGWGFALGTAEPQLGESGAFFIGFAVSTLIQIVIYGLTTALLVQLAYDSKLQRGVNIGRYFGPAITAAVPIAILGTVVGILSGIGFIALVIPGLWIYAVFSMISPAVVIERAGFGALGRSASLTKGYRWPILGAIILIGICTFLLNFVVGFVVSIAGAMIGGSTITMVLITAASSAIGVGLGGISIALVYARLREIKEGVTVDQIASVFD